MTTESVTLSIVVPVYNERDSVRSTVEALVDVTDKISGRGEVILVDDGSDDGTGPVLDSIAGGVVSVIHHDENLGYGAALKTGIRAASGEIIGITDADGTYPNDRFVDLFEAMSDGRCDMVVGARTGGDVEVPLVRRPAKWALGRLANWLSGRKIPDLNSGMRLMRREVLARFENILPDGFSFTTTITLAMMTSGFRVRFVSISYSRREGSSKIRPIYDTIGFVQLICRTVMYFNPLRIFVPMSLGLVVLSLVVLLGSWLAFDRIMDVTFGVILTASVVVMAIGMLADLIDKRTK